MRVMDLEGRVYRDGGSWTIRVPKSVLRSLGFKPGDKVNIKIIKDLLIIYAK